MQTILATLTAASLLILTGCAPQQPLARDFGNATAQNKAVQIANPEPSTAPPTYDGAHTAAAVSRYRKGEVTEVEAETTVDE